MSRFSAVLFFSASMTLSGLGAAFAPFAFAQPAHDRTSFSASQPAAIHPVAMQTAKACFTEDLVPNDDSSMLTVCGANGPSTVIFAQ